MMKTYEQETNVKKIRGVLCFGKLPQFLKRFLRLESARYDSLQGDERKHIWQHIFPRWWDLLFDHEKGKELVVGKAYKPVKYTIYSCLFMLLNFLHHCHLFYGVVIKI